MSSISNMPQTSTGEDMVGHEDYVWDIYQETEIMSTYLLAFVISEFQFRFEEENFRIWARNDVIDQTDYAAKTGPKILAFFEEYFGISYPLPKQDQVRYSPSLLLFFINIILNLYIKLIVYLIMTS
jgi:aminopeptidase N